GEHRFEMNPRPNPIGRALVHALAATRLDPQNAYARCWLAIVHFFRGENEKFEAEAQLALSLNPNDPETLPDVGHYYAFLAPHTPSVASLRAVPSCRGGQSSSTHCIPAGTISALRGSITTKRTIARPSPTWRRSDFRTFTGRTC